MTTPNDSPFSPTEIDTQVNDFISEISKEFIPDEPAPAPVAAAPVIEAPADPAKPAEQPNSVADPTERGLERLVAREVELREREKNVESASKEIETLRARLQELEPRALTPELLDKIKLSPSDGLRALGLDPDEVVRTALMEKLGDRANTPEMRDMMEKVRIRKEMEALKSQVQEAERRQQAQAYFAQVSTGANEYVKNTEGLSRHAPTVAEVAKHNPDRVFQEIMEEITRDASVRSAKGDTGDIISYQEAAMRVDKRWSAMKAMFVPSTPTVSPSPAGMTPATTPVEAKTEVKSPPTTIKPPDRPLAPWLQGEKDLEDGISAGIQEWKRIESANRR